MIRDILDEIFSPYLSFGDRCMAALVALCMLLGLGLLGLLIFVLVDSAGVTPSKTAITIVEEKQVVPAYTTMIMVGKVMVPQFHPKSYRLHFEIEEERVVSTVEQKFFDDTNVGDRIEVDYGSGRLSKSHQPTQLRLVDR